MIELILLILLLGILAFAIYMIFPAARTIPPSGWLVVNEMGIIERDLRNLKEVIVLADTIERPYSLLLDAVIDNFSEDVVYRFFVSAESYDSCRTTFYPVFRSYIDASKEIKAQQKEPASLTDELCHIYKLPFKRMDYPFIFYCYGDNGSSRPMHVIAFRGCDKGRGIAQQYRRLERGEAHSLLAATFGPLIGAGNTTVPQWLGHIGVEAFAEDETAALLNIKGPRAVHKAPLEVVK